MFFARRRHRHSLLELILVMLGIRCLCRRHRGHQPDEATRAKARQFRSKLKEAFAVWEDEEAPAEPPAE